MNGKRVVKALTRLSLGAVLILALAGCSWPGAGGRASDPTANGTGDGTNGQAVPAARIVVPEKGEPGEVVWAGNHRVAYTVQDIFAGQSQVRLLDLTTGQAATVEANSGNSALASSPDGRYLAYLGLAAEPGPSPQPVPNPDSPEGEHPRLDLIIHDLTTGRRQTAVQGISVGPVDIAWSPQGDRIAFCDLQGLWVVQVRPGGQPEISATIQPELLVPSSHASDEQAQVPREARWSPDGKWLAYSLGLWEGFGWILKVQSQGGRPVRVSQISDVWPQGWSPDGERLLLKLTPYGSEELEELWLLEMKNQKEQRLGEGKYQAVAGAWLPDGNLVVALTQDDQVRIMKHYLASGQQELIAEEKGHVYDLARSPDGRMVAYQVRVAGDGAPGAPGAPSEPQGCAVVVQPLDTTI